MRSWREQSGRVNRPVALALGGHCCPSQGSPSPSIYDCPSPRSSCGVLAIEKEPCCSRKLEQREAAKPNGDSPGDWGQTTWIWISAPPLPACVNVSTLPSLSEPQFPCLQNGNNTDIHFIGLLAGFTETMPAKYLS